MTPTTSAAPMRKTAAPRASSRLDRLCISCSCWSFDECRRAGGDVDAVRIEEGVSGVEDRGDSVGHRRGRLVEALGDEVSHGDRHFVAALDGEGALLVGGGRDVDEL